MKVAQSCPTLYNPKGYTVHGILQARILEWLAVPFSRRSPQPRDWTQVSHIAVDSAVIFHMCLWKTTKEVILSSLPFEEPFIYSIQDGVNFLVRAWRVNSCPLPLLLNCWVLITDSHLQPSQLVALVKCEEVGGLKYSFQFSMRKTGSLSCQQLPSCDNYATSLRDGFCSSVGSLDASASTWIPTWPRTGRVT